MDSREARHRVTRFLLQADGPADLKQIAGEAALPQRAARAALAGLVAEGLVVSGKLTPGKRTVQYCWRAGWDRGIEDAATRARQELRDLIEPTDPNPDIAGEPAIAFHDYVTSRYSPPQDKRFVVFLQCSVRRPFSSSPSHASMRRAIWAATGCDPRHDFERCPVHVVVMASKLGPVPYELEDCYPANVRSGGVKHFRPEYYERVKPILAQRMAEYLVTHQTSYDRAAAFTEGKYAEVMEEAKARAAGHCDALASLPVFPMRQGARIVRMGQSRPRPYWEKYWIQLYREIVSWLGPEAQRAAQARLEELDVECKDG